MLWFWIGFLVLVVLLLALDLGVLNRRAHTPSVKEALGWSAGWIALSMTFSLAVYFIYEYRLYGFADDGTVPYSGADAVLTYLTGFLLEKSLSIDNLFVMVLIFQTYDVPSHLQHRVLFWGILGAVVMRAGMILGGVWLVTNFGWVMYLFGAYLIFQGLLQLKPDKDDDEEEDGPRPLLERAERRAPGSAWWPCHPSVWSASAGRVSGAAAPEGKIAEVVAILPTAAG